MSVEEAAERLVREIESTTDLNSYCIQLGDDIMRGNLSILKLVEWLGPLLTNTRVTDREKGTLSLSYVLAALRPDFLPEKDLFFLTAFYCDRTLDHHSLSSAILQGITALIKMDHLPVDSPKLTADSPKLIFSSIFANVHCQTLMQSERNALYRIFQYFLVHKLTAIVPLGLDFVLGFITAIDGERDPNNLILLFSILPRFLTSFTLGHLTDEAFNVISCYFPIDFNPSGDDDKAIKREDLALALVPCLVAIPDFAEFCIPLALEKLDSNRRIAKLDSLHVMKEGFKSVWNSANVEPHLTDIWTALKRELIPGNADLEVRCSASETLSELLKLFSRQRPALLTSFLSDILASTCGLLSDTRLSLYSPAVDLLEVAAKASELACKQVVSNIIPKILITKKGETHNEATTINTLILFVKASIQHNQDFDIGSDVWSPVAEMIINSANIQNPSCRLSAYNGLIVLAAYLTQTQRTVIYDGCEDALTSDERVKIKCIELLKKLARIHPNEIMEKVVDTKLKLTSNKDTNHEMQDWQTEALCGLVILPDFVNPVCALLLDLIDNKPKSAPKIISCLRNLLTDSELMESGDQVLEVICRLCLKRLVEWWLEGFHKVDSNKQNATLLDIAVVIENLVKAQSSQLQAEVVCPLIETVILPRGAEGDGSNYKDLFKKSKHSVIILQALLGYVRPNVLIKNWLPLTTSLADVSFSEKDPLIRDSASELLATLINKQQKDEILATILGHTAKHLEQKLASRDSKSKVNAVKLLSWVTKSLVLRGHGLMAYWIDKLTDQLADCKEPGREAADGYRLIVEEDKLFLIAKSNSMLRIFYRQRLFQRALALASISRTCSRACKPNYLTALAYLVKSVPKSVLLPSLRQIMIPLVESLDEGEDKLELTTLHTLSGLLAEKEPALLSYTDTFIPRFLKLAKESHSMKVRIGALECLKFYASYPPVQIVPYVEDVSTKFSHTHNP
ncbi:hypothetical protein LSTR_LSTR009034 [Laodelphax striatellus]|uniref:MMS19 nucleotide excision repair protein n=1 Tax=Laodelphax striatellus TaxID=195883 RepID=A0A482XCI8_LAOST|nr:hypothetical protein LSTR_LSTR009034 [Laodelphax striatellus]